jgi:hypothetical protein
VCNNYIKECSGLWIVAPIARAVSEKVAKDLMGPNFRLQAVLDGQTSNITFICSKTDDVSTEEVIREGFDRHGKLRASIDQEKELLQELQELEKLRAATRWQQPCSDDSDSDFEIINPRTTRSQGRRKGERATRRATNRATKRKPDAVVPEAQLAYIRPASRTTKTAKPPTEPPRKQRKLDDASPVIVIDDDDETQTSRQHTLRKQSRQTNSGVSPHMQQRGSDDQDYERQIEQIKHKLDRLRAKRSRHCIKLRNDASRREIRHDFAEGLREYVLFPCRMGMVLTVTAFQTGQRHDSG